MPLFLNTVMELRSYKSENILTRWGAVNFWKRSSAMGGGKSCDSHESVENLTERNGFWTSFFTTRI
jgi:hypothetical protein